MKIERRKMGTRVRVILNRTEAREAGLNALFKAGILDNHPNPRTAHVFIGGIGRGHGDYHADPSSFENECKLIAAKKIIIPMEASFRVGLDAEGHVVGATFQYYESNHDDVDDYD